MTNADMIRSMDDEELSIFLTKVKEHYQQRDNDYLEYLEREAWLKWLQSVAE